MAISQLVFEDFVKYLDKCNSVLELGNQTFTRECIAKYQNELGGFNNYKPVKEYVKAKHIKHVEMKNI